jgi:hypothetical protein
MRSIELALQLGCVDAAAVRHLMVTDQLAHQRPVLLLDIGALTRYERSTATHACQCM